MQNVNKRLRRFKQNAGKSPIRSPFRSPKQNIENRQKTHVTLKYNYEHKQTSYDATILY